MATNASPALHIYVIGMTGELSLKDDLAELYEYDAFNRLTEVQNKEGTTVYAYKPDGLRLSKTVNGLTTTHIWDGSNIVMDVTGVESVRYIRGINLIKSEKSGFYLFNAHGDVVQLADTNGTVTRVYRYDAFGVEKEPDQGDQNPFRYCAEYYDKETGSVYLRARYYEPANSRMLSEDPYWRYNNNPTPNINEIMQSANLYVYCANSPLSFIDPNGLDMRIIVNTNSAAAWDGGPTLGHMGVLVQNSEGEWYYFSAGSNYVQFEPVGEEYLQDLEKFSKKYYGGYDSVGAYNKSVYIKGDFTESFDFYKAYFNANEKDGNASSYNQFTNNCSHVVFEGFNKGILNDGTNVGWFVVERMGINYSYSLLPRWQIGDLQNIFYNNAFEYDDYHKQLNDQLWEYRNSPYFWNRSKTNAKFVERIM